MVNPRCNFFVSKFYFTGDPFRVTVPMPLQKRLPASYNGIQIIGHWDYFGRFGEKLKNVANWLKQNWPGRRQRNGARQPIRAAASRLSL